MPTNGIAEKDIPEKGAYRKRIKGSSTFLGVKEMLLRAKVFPLFVCLAIFCLAVLALPANPASAVSSAAVTEWGLPYVNSYPVGITAGPDGALWFTETDGNEIGRITTAGAISEWALPHANSRPRGIAAGPDGALWFAEYGGNRIGRITTAGAISEIGRAHV